MGCCHWRCALRFANSTKSLSRRSLRLQRDLGDQVRVEAVVLECGKSVAGLAAVTLWSLMTVVLCSLGPRVTLCLVTLCSVIVAVWVLWSSLSAQFLLLYSLRRSWLCQGGSAPLHPPVLRTALDAALGFLFFLSFHGICTFLLTDLT